MLSANGLPASASLEGGGLPGSDLGSAVNDVAPGGYTGRDVPSSMLNPALITLMVNRPLPGYASAAPDVNTGIGQLLITTGANTPGIGSFASATNGFATSNSTGSG